MYEPSFFGCWENDVPNRDDTSKEFTHLDGIVPFGIEEIQTVPLLRNINRIPTALINTSLSGENSKTNLWALCFKINCSNHKKVLL